MFKVSTRSEDLADHLRQRLKGLDVDVDYDPDQKDGAVLYGSQGERLGTYPINDPTVASQIRHKITEHTQSHSAKAEVRHYTGTTGEGAVATAYSLRWAAGYTLTVRQVAGESMGHIRIRQDDREVGDVEIEPQVTLDGRLREAIMADLTQQRPGIIARLEALQEARKDQAPAPALITVQQIPTGGVMVSLWLSGQEGISDKPGNRSDSSQSFSRGPNTLRDTIAQVEAWQRHYPKAVVKSEIDLAASPKAEETRRDPTVDAQVSTPVGPAYVECAACGRHFGAEYVATDPPPLARKCDCGHDRFREYDPPAKIVGTLDVVMNPVLVAETMTEQRIPSNQGDEVIQQIPIAQIAHFPGGNVRQRFRNMEGLIGSIAEVGVKIPLIVNRTDTGYTLIAGERRLRAAGKAGLTEVPCIVRQMSQANAYRDMLLENHDREPLTAIEWARGYQHMIELGATQETIAKQFGISRQSVGEHLRLLQLPEIGQNAVEDGMAIKAALLFLSRTEDMPDSPKQKVAAQFFRDRPSIRDAEAQLDMYIRMSGWTPPKPQAAPPPATTPASQLSPTNAARAASLDSSRDLRADKQMLEGTLKAGKTPFGEKLGKAQKDEIKQRIAKIDEELATVAPGEQKAPAQITILSAEANQALGMRVVGRSLWKSNAPENQAAFDQEHYLTPEELMVNWTERQALKVHQMPPAFGWLQIDIPEQRVEISHVHEAQGGPLIINQSAATITARNAYGRVTAVYTGSPVYYRVRMEIDQAGAKRLRQQVVIRDGGRHIVLTGEGTVIMRKEQLPELEALIAKLPGLPPGVEVAA